MRIVHLGVPPQDDASFKQWVVSALSEIENASQEGIELVADAYTITGTITESRSFNAGTADATALRNIIATFINDLKKRGSKAT